MHPEKHTEQVKVMLTESELLDASRLAAIEDRTLSDFIRLQLRNAMYGKVAQLSTNRNRNDMDHEGQK